MVSGLQETYLVAGSKQSIPPAISYSVYVDDIQIGYISCSLGICERQVQLALRKLCTWADHNGFNFNSQKSTCMLFSRKSGIAVDPNIHPSGQQLAVSTEHKFLGIILDTKLTFIPHLKYLKGKCLKAMKIIKILSHTTWGSDRKCLMNLYKSLVRSRLDYGAPIYQSATHSALRTLDSVHHLGIRLATGAFRTFTSRQMNGHYTCRGHTLALSTS